MSIMMMMMFLHCNQRLLTSELYFTSGRVLSIQSNPYQALRLRQQNTNKENSNCNDEKWKWSIWLQQSNLVFFTFGRQREVKGFLPIENPPANHHTNVWIKVFHATKLNPHSTTPPSPRAPPCSRRNGLRGICSVVHISFVHVSCQLALLCQRSQSNKISLATDLVRSSPTPNPFNWPLTSLFQLYKCPSKAASSPCSTQRARINFFSSNKDNVCTQFHEIIIPPFLVIVDNG